MSVKTIEEINEKINKGTAVVLTAEEIIGYVEENGVKKALEEVDVVTTATFGPMCSSGVFLNFGHSNPPIKMTELTLNDVPAYAGLAAVDAYIGATEISKTQGLSYGGAHVIQDLIDGKDIALKATSYGTDCYPKKEISTYINKDNINQAFMFNPRNAYQNYVSATNSSSKTLYTYMGTLLPNYGNVTYSTSGQLSPLLNDPYYRTIGVGTTIFLGGTKGYVAWEGTQHNPNQNRNSNGIPISPAGSLSLIGDIKQMSSKYVRAAVYEKYGISLFVGIGIPIPIIDEEILLNTCIKDSEIFTNIIDYSVSEGQRPIVKEVSYAELRSGFIEINKKVRTSPVASLKVAGEIADILKDEIKKGDFNITAPVKELPKNTITNKLELREERK